MKDDLSKLLGEWSEPVTAPAGFNHDVWARIESASTSVGWFDAFLGAVARPRVALALAAMAIACGVLAGTAFSRESGSEAYLRSVNPYAMNR